MVKEGKHILYLSTSEEIPPESYLLAKVLVKPTFDENLGPEHIEELYFGDCCLADSLFAWGLIRHFADKTSLVLIFSPEDEIPPTVIDL